MSFGRKMWLSAKSVAGKVANGVFVHSPRIRQGLGLISQGMETMIFSRGSTGGNRPRTAGREALPEHTDLGLNIAGFLKGEFGLGTLSRSMVKAAEAASIPYVLNNVEAPGHSYADRDVGRFSEDNPFAVNLILVNADTTEWFHNVKGPGYSKGRRNVGHWAWELSKFPDEWLSSFQFYNEIWVLSNFSLDAISRVSPVPVVKVPPCIELDTKSLTAHRSQFGIPDSAYVFLFNFDYHSYFARKNPIAVVSAFGKAFGDSSDVRLVLKSINGAHHEAEARKLRRAVGGAGNILLMEDHIRTEHLHSLVACCDCYVSLHRAEGFGLTMAEAMYLGKPVIATGYSGNMDFMNPANSLAVGYKLIEVRREEYVASAEGYVWADPDIDHAADLMRSLYKDKQRGVNMGQRASEDIKALLSPAVVGSAIRDRLLRILVPSGA